MGAVTPRNGVVRRQLLPGVWYANDAESRDGVLGAVGSAVDLLRVGRLRVRDGTELLGRLRGVAGIVMSPSTTAIMLSVNSETAQHHFGWAV